MSRYRYDNGVAIQEFVPVLESVSLTTNRFSAHCRYRPPVQAENTIGKALAHRRLAVLQSVSFMSAFANNVSWAAIDCKSSSNKIGER